MSQDNPDHPERAECLRESIIDTARKIISLGPICDSCLGRQFAMLATGLSNPERGRSLKTALAMQACAAGDQAALEALAPTFEPARLLLSRRGEEDAGCTVCLGMMAPAKLDGWADRAAAALSGIEYETFLVGTRMSGLLSENEELLLADGGSQHAEPFKSELNREVGKRLAQLTKKKFDLKSPDVVLHLNLETCEVELQVASLFIRGRYRKLVRGIPQTRWPCRQCRGRGCPRCQGTGRMYQESVDELIRPAVMEAAAAEDTVFHGAGREDIDARMLGSGRPFIVEAVRPRIRTIDLPALQEEINRRAGGRVEVLDIAPATADMVERLKEAAFVKTYSALVRLGGDVGEEKLKSVLTELVGPVDQRTPARVSHRRADKLRVRKVYSADLLEIAGRMVRINIKGDSGLYIKELISGDGGRTRPSLSEALRVDAIVEELDVIDVGGESDGTSSRNAEEVQRQAEQDDQD
ncbi:MAG TPA: tRNA pseudouridine(54/55) synthase Pus10 [Methanothrix sp.]|nr:tRNA pseudouridine(54/55) synthase Pus10 [Methanothrix sp.]HPC90143.1 tRNA pseudouridine(54/55) synthase Pus10 [Methanothrix sp.]HQE86904.1 tRNA pseudouridine(54/55) synthase Pus10 [Methanothrix sp.]HQI67853.1 tRNA pseudouridine(54/55) synthase Pus10 [Methanothrix sp.]HRS85510.1 tRNA pseudouridine(54/55) synthase Pus10 [Methanothrix sp.]